MYENMSRESLIRELENRHSLQNRLDLREKELNALMTGTRAILEQRGFTETARAIFDNCKDLIGATSGYVALLSDDGMENEVLFLESGNLPCSVNPELPMPIRGLRAEAYRYNKVVYHNDFMNSEWVDFMPQGHVVLTNVMFAPLIIADKTVGIMGLANKAADFTEADAESAAWFGDLAAIALRNSRDLDLRQKAEADREQTIRDLMSALDKVKLLSGLLPICSSCRKIRDDNGYWRKIEDYVETHSEAEFSHSICQTCAKELYPDIDVYEE
ncbi:MAG: GAF domain-containing protein [Desulfobacterales bacterium]|nr:GAF domain-containing protein [Desulfobacterales bacterium]